MHVERQLFGIVYGSDALEAGDAGVCVGVVGWNETTDPAFDLQLMLEVMQQVPARMNIIVIARRCKCDVAYRYQGRGAVQIRSPWRKRWSGGCTVGR